MRTLQKIAAIGLLILLAATGYGWWYTNQPARAAARPGRLAQPTDAATGVDQNAFALAQRLAALAEGSEEQALTQSAQRLADHELDLAFTAALRRIEAHPPQLSPQAQLIQDRLDKSQRQLETDQASVTRLTAAVAQASDAQRNALQDQLDLATSQVELDKDEVEEANQDLLDAGGNLHQRIQNMMQKHAAADQVHPNAASSQKPASGPQGLVRRISQWLALRHKQEWLVFAGSQADSDAQRLTARRQRLADALEASKAGVPGLANHAKSAQAPAQATVTATAPGAATPGATATAGTRATARTTTTAVTAMSPANAPNTGGGQGPGAVTNLLSTTRQIGADQRGLALLDQRISTLKELAGVYASWNALTAASTMSALHSVLVGTATVLAIILLLLFVDGWLERLLSRAKLDRRQAETLRSVTRVALQILGVVIILLIVVGMPGQLGTMIGLAGAGLTVALKDFIVAFIGWLVLMGRNGLRLGDWVEINGVSGEVVELGMFHTVLLETGNWTDSGHPTGRRVTFTNSFAIEKHYFNFSTSGQWLWDELLVLVPYDKDPNLIAEEIHKEVLAATTAGATQAEQEWRRTAPGRRGSVFSAAPGISVRPAVGGVEVGIRYITKASERFQLRSKLFQSAVRLLGSNMYPLPAARTRKAPHKEPPAYPDPGRASPSR